MSNGAVVIQYLINTAGRRIDFNYQNNRLTSISQDCSGVTFYYLRIDYSPVIIQTNFYNMTTDPATINGSQVYLPFASAIGNMKGRLLAVDNLAIQDGSIAESGS